MNKEIIDKVEMFGELHRQMYVLLTEADELDNELDLRIDVIISYTDKLHRIDVINHNHSADKYIGNVSTVLEEKLHRHNKILDIVRGTLNMKFREIEEIEGKMTNIREELKSTYGGRLKIANKTHKSLVFLDDELIGESRLQKEAIKELDL